MYARHGNSKLHLPKKYSMENVNLLMKVYVPFAS